MGDDAPAGRAAIAPPRRLPDTGPPRRTVRVDRPPDFDAFWDALCREAGELPLDPVVRPVLERSTVDVDVFEIHYASLDGLRISGWYCAPAAQVLAPPYPGLVLSPGYISEATIPKSWARLGYAALSLAPRGKLRSNAAFNPGYPGLLVDNIVDRDTYAYRGFYVDALRGLEVLVTRPEVDAGRIGVHGSSQGGALSVVLAALRPDVVTCCAAGAPYLCGIVDAARLTHSYPYEEINEYLRIHPEHVALVAEAVAYYDGVNFAPLIRCPTLVYVGELDDVCPPETAAALVNALAGPAELIVREGCAHEAGARWAGRDVEAFLAAHLHPKGLGRDGR